MRNRRWLAGRPIIHIVTQNSFLPFPSRKVRFRRPFREVWFESLIRCRFQCCLAWVQWGGRSLLRRYFGLREIRVVANGCETNPVQPENVPSRTSNGYNRIEKHSNCKESCRPGYFPARTACATKLGVASDLKWQANLRVLEVTEIKTVPYVPLSHPFVERLIGDNGENTWTRRSSGQRPIWRRSYSSSNITIMHIERTPG